MYFDFFFLFLLPCLLVNKDYHMTANFIGNPWPLLHAPKVEMLTTDIPVCRFGDLRLVTTSKLDREMVDSYQLVVVAYDGGDPVKSGSLKVTVKVVDTNDNVPVFGRAAYEFTVTEDQPPGSVVGKVRPVNFN